MNYIKELNAFREFLLVNKLPAGAIALWYTLMSMNNAARWKRRFNAPNVTVGQLAGLSRQGVLDARNKLIEHGLITCENGQKGKAPIYEMISLVQVADALLDTQLDTSLDLSPDEDLTVLKHKQNQERRHDGTAQAQLMTIYEENIGKLSPLMREDFLQWQGQVGETIMLEAIKQASRHGGQTFGYLEKILTEWEVAQVETPGDITAYRKRRNPSEDNSIPFRRQPKQKKQSLFDELREEAGL